MRGIRTRFNECGTPNDLKVRRYAPTVNSTTTVINTDPAVAPTIGGTVAGQTTTSEAPVHPFAGVTISDPNAGASDTLTITLSNNGATGTLSGSGLSGGTNGVYTLAAASAATLSSELQQLVFTPTAGAPGSNTTTTFTLSDLSSADATPTVNSTTTVINTDPAVAPSIGGTVAGQTTTSEAPVHPFAGVTISDPNAGASDTLTITLSNNGATGTLSGSGLAAGPTASTPWRRRPLPPSAASCSSWCSRRPPARPARTPPRPSR